MSICVKGECRNTGRTHFQKGVIPWNKGKTGIYTEKHRKEIGEFTRKRLIENHPMKGKKHTPEAIEKIRIARMNQSTLNLSNCKGKPWSQARRDAQASVKRAKKIITSPKKTNLGGKEYHPAWKEIRKIIYKRYDRLDWMRFFSIRKVTV